MKKYALFVGALFILPLVFFAPRAHALQLSPTIFDISAKPGQTIVKSVRLGNETKEDLTLTYQTGIFEAAPEGNGVPRLLPAPKDINSIANWISVTTPQITLRPGEKVDAPFTITIPENAEPGGHYAWIAWNEAPGKTDGTGVAISCGIATQILLRVDGDAKEGLILRSFSTKDGKTNFEKLPVSFVATIYNDGNVHEKPRGEVVIKNMLGSTVGKLPFNDVKDTGNILPKQDRSYNVEWNNGIAFGKYTAQLNAQYADGKTISGEVHFWVLPKVLFAVWLLIITIVSFIIIMAVVQAIKKKNKRIVTK